MKSTSIDRIAIAHICEHPEQHWSCVTRKRSLRECRMLQFKNTSEHRQGKSVPKFFHIKKAQAAMEFLMTYGWAILVVLAAIVALAYFGVMSPAKFFPEACTISGATGLACLDFSITPVSAHLFLSNSGGRDFIIDNISIGSCLNSFGQNMPDGTTMLFNVTGCDFGVSGKKIKETLSISYTDASSNFTKSMQGSISASVS